jgi:hypothetical protein
MAELMNGRGRVCCGMLIAVVSLTACNRKEPAPAAETQTATPVQSANAPTTVTGCLRAGDASNTFVLTAARSASSEQTATYQLYPRDGVTLTDHVGEQVAVTGMLRAQQQVQSRSTTEPAGKPTGTGGTPAVSTSTALEIKQLDVEQVRPAGGKCPDEEKK